MCFVLLLHSLKIVLKIFLVTVLIIIYSWKKIILVPLGCQNESLPQALFRHPIVKTILSQSSRNPYHDNLRLFRPIACGNFGSDGLVASTKFSVPEFPSKTGEDSKIFTGVLPSEIHDVEQIVKMNLYVYSICFHEELISSSVRSAQHHSPHLRNWHIIRQPNIRQSLQTQNFNAFFVIYLFKPSTDSVITNALPIVKVDKNHPKTLTCILSNVLTRTSLRNYALYSIFS